MAHIARAAATLRISGDDLEPDEVSTLLGATPTRAQKKGQVLGGASGVTRIAKFGMWRLEAEDTISGDLDAQVQEILGKLTDDLGIWDRLGARYSIDLFCGWFMEEENEGMGVSASALRALGTRGIELSLDIYTGGKEGQNPSKTVSPDSGQS